MEAAIPSKLEEFDSEEEVRNEFVVLVDWESKRFADSIRVDTHSA